MSKNVEKEAFLKAYPKALKKHGSQRKACEMLGVSRSTAQDWLRPAPVFTARAPKPAILIPIPKRETRRFIFTSAQDRSKLHEPFWRNLVAYADYMNAKIMVSGYTYDKRLYEENRKDEAHADYPEVIRPYLSDRQVQVGDGLVWCGEMNTLPTAVQPLTGFEVYTRSRWGIFPHAKVQLRSIATMKGMPAKQIMTTGTVTQANYIQRRAGIVAHFHHVIGAVLVEIDQDGDHFVRHLLAEDDTGNFQDLTCYVHDGLVEEGCEVEAIGWGDIHLEKMDWDVARSCWGIEQNTPTTPTSMVNSIIDALRPSYQFFHDTTDFTVRNHHSVKDPHVRFKLWLAETESVDQSFQAVQSFLRRTHRDYCRSVVVRSNHDEAAERWLRDADWKIDPVNAEFYLQAQLAMLSAIRHGKPFSVLEWAVSRGTGVPDMSFLAADESYPVRGIEMGMHGHLGGNGAPGSPLQFTKMGPKANTGHTHCPGITDGIYTAGVTGKLDMDYNRGLSGWAHAHIVTYPNGKRIILTMQGGKWCA